MNRISLIEIPSIHTSFETLNKQYVALALILPITLNLYVPVSLKLIEMEVISCAGGPKSAITPLSRLMTIHS